MAELPDQPLTGHPSAHAGLEGELVTIACREFVELVTEYQEGALAPDVEAAVRAHLALCDHCAEYLAQMRRTSEALRDVPPPTLPPHVRAELLEVFTRLHPTTGP